jgi:putative RecB family exonuclease
VPSYRSFSQLRGYRECGEAFRLARIERVSKRPSAAQVAGVMIHTGTEPIDHAIHAGIDDRAKLVQIAGDALAASRDATVAEFSENYAPEEWKRFGRATKEKPNGEDLAWFESQGIPLALGAYVDWRLSKPNWKLAEIPGFGPAIEVPFTVPLGDVQVNGYIDRVFTVDGFDGYYVMDIKSGRKPKTDEQLGVYARALEVGLHWPVTYGFFIYGLKSGTASITPPLDIRHWSAEKLTSTYANLDLGITSKVFVPNPGEACFVCDVQSHCAFAQAVI